MGKREYKDIAYKFDDLTEEGEFNGYLSVFGNVDSDNDIVEPGAFKKTLQENPVFPLFFHHDSRHILGDFTAREDRKGLRIHASLEMGIQEVKDKRLLMKRGVLKGLSIGFEAIKADWKGDVRHLTEIRLWEGSVVPFASNQEAYIGAIKNMDDLSPNDIQRIIERLQARKSITPEIREMLITTRKGIDALIELPEPPTGTHKDGEPHTDDKPLLHLRSMCLELQKLNQMNGG